MLKGECRQLAAAVPVTKLQTNADTVSSIKLRRHSMIHRRINSIIGCTHQRSII